MDSFFGFDTSLPEDISDEEEYDALNDETFGAADKGDWKDIHEHLVRLESCRNGGRTGSFLGEDEDDGGSSDNNNSESGRSSVVAQSIGDEFANKLWLDPSIWGSPAKVPAPVQPPYSDYRPSGTPFSALPPQQSAFRPPEPAHPIGGGGLPPKPPPSLPPGLFPPMKMLSVEDIERTIIQHQHQQNQHQSMLQKQMSQQQQQQQQQHQLHYHHNQFHQQQQQQTLQPFRTPAPVPAQPPPPVKARDHFTPAKEVKSMQPPIPMISSPVAAPPLRVPPALLTPPLSLLGARNAGPAALFPPGPSQPPPPAPPPPMLNNANRIPLGLLPYKMLAARPYSTPINTWRCIRHSRSAARTVPAARVSGGPARYRWVRHRRYLAIGTSAGSPPFLMQRSPTPLPTNQFNQRLVQEIQQNHPLLAFNRQLAAASTLSVCGNGVKQPASSPAKGGFMKQQHHFQQQQQQRSRVGNGMPSSTAGGGQPEERDEYANMSNRNKQWLIGIQLTQLNSDAPYFNDYYFTVYKQRLAAAKAGGACPAAVTALLSKNGKSGLLGTNRERRSSESRSNPNGGSEGKDGSAPTGGGRAYTPLQFQNSLGKLQCGSVIAPRKLIDADVMGSDQLNGNGVPALEPPPAAIQRKARHVLLLIETLYKLVLKLEDLGNPVAIDAMKALREKKMRERTSSTGSGSGVACLSEAGAKIGNALIINPN
ncbi:protein PAT1 homolog 1-like [Anopheles merus]|uniref:protein PAT1 homolog 1-like n=1 Tax=Anopheles merus TaxID=30066 RepID=UPI001BE45E43|nr:protein PAT1 homolog 1-like [Anopheles merus]